MLRLTHPTSDGVGLDVIGYNGIRSDACDAYCIFTPWVLFMAAIVEIYTWSSCPFCVKAKRLLDAKGVKYTEYCLDGDEAGRSKMAAERSAGEKSMPQVFVNDQHLGGCDDLHALDRSGELEKLLAA